MNEDAAAKDLEKLLRDALNGVEAPRVAQAPLLQLNTVPLKVQPVPVAKERESLAPRIAADSHVPPEAKARAKSAEEPAARTEAAPEKTKPARGGRSMILGMTLIALGATAGAAWYTRMHSVAPAPVAVRAASPAAETASADEGSVAIAVAARPAEAPPPAVAKPAETPASTPNVESAAPSVKIEPAKAEAPKAETAKVETAKADAPKPKPEAKTETAKADAPKPKPEAKVAHAAATPKAEPKPVAEKTAAPPPTPAPAAHAGGSVDALLQQQLKGAL